MNESPDEERYVQVLLMQYEQCWEDIRDYNRQIWQIPAVLTAIITFIGILYSSSFPSVFSSHLARVAALLLALGFALISFVALKKHRFFCDRRVDDFNDLQGRLRDSLRHDFKGKMKEIEWQTWKFQEAYCINATSAYKWQYGLVIAILMGILALLAQEIGIITW